MNYNDRCYSCGVVSCAEPHLDTCAIKIALDKMGYWDSKPGDMFHLDADITIYWPSVRPCWEEKAA